jgi:hypothetical protein
MIWVSDSHGTGKDLLLGMAWGTIIGGGAGLLLGILEGALRSSPPPSSRTITPTALRVGFGFAASERGAPIPYPTLSGRF